VTYRELRLLELEVLKLLLKNQQVTDVGLFSQVNVDAMCGIEINEFPALIAEVAMWLIDHQMNLLLSEEFGQYFIRLPLKKSAKIVNANALRFDWAEVIKPEECSYILGNPPFVGQTYRTEEQNEEVRRIFGKTRLVNSIDYVACWYVLATKYMKENEHVSAAFVSTNSITQGEQVDPIWTKLQSLGTQIAFAHRTFSWQSNSRGKAHVHVVIIGFSVCIPNQRFIIEHANATESIKRVVKQINPYLIDANPSTIVASRSTPLCKVKPMIRGNQPSDGGNLILSGEETTDLKNKDPLAAKFIRRYVGSDEFINNRKRYCLWLRDASPHELGNSKEILQRLAKVREFRLKSTAKPTRDKANIPHDFFFVCQPRTDYILIPGVSSERRKYIPIGFMDPLTIASNLVYIIPDANVFDFGVLTSALHMAWMRTVCGRMKSDYRYTGSTVYNTFPWPQNPTDKQKANVEAKAQAVLDARAKYPESSLADLYDPLTMPPELVKAHEQLDKAVEQCYRSKPFESDRERVEYLFQLYEQLAAPLTAQADKPKRARKKKTEDAE
jgi:hypothetical protein